jgi:5,10-methenyltetrahydrofolate synthetase
MSAWRQYPVYGRDSQEVALTEHEPPDISEPKSQWRVWANRIDRSAASLAVCEHLAAWPPLHGVVATYLPMGSEISLESLLAQPTIAPVIPRIEESGEMAMRSYDPDRLVRHRLGFDEPDENSVVVEPDDIDVMLLPGLVFDKDGGRLGRGKGYYDRIVASLPGSTACVGVTREADIVDAVPMDDHDQRIGWLATESGVRWVGPAVSPDTERFMKSAVGAGIAPNIEHFPAGTRTSKDAAAAVGCELGAIAKSLVFMVDDQPVLVICSGDRRVDEGKLASVFGGTRARPATRDMVQEVTGYPAGGTPAVGHDLELATVADIALGRYRFVWSAGGTLDTVYEVTLERLIAASGARWADISEEENP